MIKKRKGRERENLGARFHSDIDVVYLKNNLAMKPRYVFTALERAVCTIASFNRHTQTSIVIVRVEIINGHKENAPMHRVLLHGSIHGPSIISSHFFRRMIQHYSTYEKRRM